MKKVYILISITSSQNQTLLNVIEYFKSIGISMSNIYLITNTNDKIIQGYSINIIRLAKISSAKIMSAVFLKNDEHQEIQSTIRHQKPNCKSFQKIKNICLLKVKV